MADGEARAGVFGHALFNGGADGGAGFLSEPEFIELKN